MVGRSAAALSRSKQFPAARVEEWRSQQPSEGDAGHGRHPPPQEPLPQLREEEKDVGAVSASDVLSVDEFMELEFSRIIGHDSIKTQLRQFYKKVQLDRIRSAHGKDTDHKRLYHMIFDGPPGTGTHHRH